MKDDVSQQRHLFTDNALTVAPIISVVGLKTAFGKHVVHENLDLTVYPGEILSLVGGSGSGKTTLLRQIMGLDTPAAGTIKVLGMPVSEMSPFECGRLARRWGVLFQAGALFSALSVFDNVALPLRELRSLEPSLIRDLVMLKLDLVEIESKHC